MTGPAATSTGTPPTSSSISSKDPRSRQSSVTRVTPRAVHAEASRLVAGGLILDRRVGNTRLLRAADGTPLTRPLTDLLAVTYGPLPVPTDAFRSVPGVRRVLIYGSWAARYSGEIGPVPVDVDVLVIGTADLDDLEVVARRPCRQAVSDRLADISPQRKARRPWTPRRLRVVVRRCQEGPDRNSGESGPASHQPRRTSCGLPRGPRAAGPGTWSASSFAPEPR